MNCSGSVVIFTFNFLRCEKGPDITASSWLTGTPWCLNKNNQNYSFTRRVFLTSF